MELERMNPAVKYVPFPAECMRAARNLTDEQRLRLYDAICILGFTGEVTDFADDPLLDCIFVMAIPSVSGKIDHAVNGSKGGRPRKEKGA